MEKVLARREINRKTLEQYVLDESRRCAEKGMSFVEAAEAISLDPWAHFAEDERMYINTYAAYRELGALHQQVAQLHAGIDVDPAALDPELQRRIRGCVDDECLLDVAITGVVDEIADEATARQAGQYDRLQHTTELAELHGVLDCNGHSASRTP